MDKNGASRIYCVFNESNCAWYVLPYVFPGDVHHIYHFICYLLLKV